MMDDYLHRVERKTASTPLGLSQQFRATQGLARASARTNSVWLDVTDLQP
jgi:hypothetical protein